MKNTICLSLGYLLILCSCSPKGTSEESMSDKIQPVEVKNPVHVMILESTIFQKELISNGKLNARHKSILRFSTGEELAALNVKNGDRVRTGEIIARLRQDKLQQAVSQSELSLAKAELDLRDILLGQQYQLEDSTRIPKNILDIAKLRSGYSTALSNLGNARLNLANSVLIAPFSGIVANIKHKVYEQVSASEEFCTLIDNSAYEVVFSVLETEITDVSLNKSVKVTPFIQVNDVYQGRITEINPVVDENGHIIVKALVENTDGLMQGMNVRVRIETAVSNQLVVPKPAVVQRQDQEVLFRYTNGTAFWTYVNTNLENSTSFTVVANTERAATLNPGDTVIISGNLNLAHGSRVVIE